MYVYVSKGVEQCDNMMLGCRRIAILYYMCRNFIRNSIMCIVIVRMMVKLLLKVMETRDNVASLQYSAQDIAKRNRSDNVIMCPD